MAKDASGIKLTSPQVYLWRMAVFLVIAAFVGLLLSRQLKTAFMANPGLNGLIFSVALVGILRRGEPHVRVGVDRPTAAADCGFCPVTSRPSTSTCSDQAGAGTWVAPCSVSLSASRNGTASVRPTGTSWSPRCLPLIWKTIFT